MQDEELRDQEENFGSESIGEDILDVFDESLEDDLEEGLTPHLEEESEEDGLFDFYGDEDDRDSMY